MRNDGFSLTEVIVAIAIVAIMAAAAAPMVVSRVETARSTATVRRMESIIGGMVGDPAEGRFGYVGDMGGLPPDLPSLVALGAQPVYAVGINGVGTGWNGPYVQFSGPGAQLANDSWGTGLVYGGAAQLTSLGRDRQLGTADDITLPAAAAVTIGNVVVTVLGLPNTGPPAVALDTTDVAGVSLSRSNNGNPATDALGWNGVAFAHPGTHLGAHTITVTGQAAYAAASAAVTARVQPGTNAVTITLVQP